MEINEKVRTLRELNKMSQEEMAAKLGMSTNGYAKIERGKRRLDIPKLEQIAAVFGIDIVDLMEVDKSVVCLINENDLKQGVICLINKNSLNNNTYYSGTEELLHEIDRLKLMLSHKDELLQQKDREIKLMQDLLSVAKTESSD